MRFPKVYEYVDEEGNTFWSFTQLRARMTPGKMLVLQNRTGRFLIQFLTDLRKEWRLFSDPEKPDATGKVPSAMMPEEET